MAHESSQNTGPGATPPMLRILPKVRVGRAQRLRLNPIETDWCLNNQSGNRMLPDASSTDHCLLHYCFGDDSFNKRTVRLEREVTDPEFWSIPGGDGTVNGFLRDQFRHTGAFFGVLPETSEFFPAPES